MTFSGADRLARILMMKDGPPSFFGRTDTLVEDQIP
jgi:hypothetical protein